MVSAKADLHIIFEFCSCKVEGQLMRSGAILDSRWLCLNSGGRIAMAIEIAHDPWHNTAAWAVGDWGVMVSVCGAPELLRRRRGRHVFKLDVFVLCLGIW